MNIQDIQEPISVLAAFSGGTAQPKRFRWGQREYSVDTINGKWIDRSGDGYRLCYSIQAGGQTCYVHFDSAQVQWWLDRIITE